MDAFRKDADSTQTTHIGFDMDRINTLFIDINVENLRQLVCGGVVLFLRQ